MGRYNWRITINLPTAEVEIDLGSLTANEVMDHIAEHYPTATSVVLVATL